MNDHMKIKQYATKKPIGQQRNQKVKKISQDK